MKIKNIDIVNMINKLSNYCEKRLPQKIGYAITKNIMTLDKEYSAYEKQLGKIINVYRDNIIKDKDGNQVIRGGVPVVEDSVAEEYYSQINDLLNIEIDVDLRYVEESVFDYDNGTMYDSLSAKDIMILQSLLVKQEEKKDEKNDKKEDDAK